MGKHRFAPISKEVSPVTPLREYFCLPVETLVKYQGHRMAKDEDGASGLLGYHLKGLLIAGAVSTKLLN